MGNKTAQRRKAKATPIPRDYRRVSEAATLTNTNPSTIYRWARTGRIKSRRIGPLIYVHLKDVKKARQSQKRGSTPRPALPRGMVTTARAAAETGACQVSIQTWARKGLIRAQRYGKKKKIWYVNLSDAKKRARIMKPGRQR